MGEIQTLQRIAAESARLKGHHMEAWRQYWRAPRRTALAFCFCGDCSREARVVGGEIQGSATLVECDAAPFRYQQAYKELRT